MTCFRSAPFLIPFITILSGAGCASTGGAQQETGGAARAHTGPLELEATRWKLPVAEGQMDGRIIQFKRSSDGRYMGEIIDLGRQLHGKVGAYLGLVMIELWPSKEANTYEGLFRKPSREPVEATFSISDDGQVLKCSVDDSRWVRAE